MMRDRLQNKATLWVLGWVIAVGFGAFAISGGLQHFHITYRGEVRFLAVVLSTIPAIWVFVSLASIIARPIAAAVVLFAVYVLSEIHKIKYTSTSEPLLWSDITTLNNAGIVLHYVTPAHLLFVIVFFLAFLLLAWISRARLFRISRPDLVVGILLFPLVFHPSISRTAEVVGNPITGLLATAGVEYRDWDWSSNVKHNGLLWHLVQTSQRQLPAKPTSEQARQYQALIAREGSAPAVDEVILIFCEACWHKDYHFVDNFEPLLGRGFQEFRAIAPTYGGGTVNGAFELITGLPANGALNGVIYQEYADDIRADAHTLPAALVENGFAAISAHNNRASFWRRDEVLPKLGFERFIGLEDMAERHSGWTRDYVLYDTALSVRAEILGPKFFFLTTVYSHGPYTINDDLGEQDYAYKLRTSIQDLVAFTDAVLADNPDALILVIGDHKPALNEYFSRHNILSRSMMAGLVRDQAVLGDVPVYIYHSDNARVAAMTEMAEGASFFCLANALNDLFLGAVVPAFEFSADYNLCSQSSDQRYESLTQEYPGWLYHSILF